MEMIAVIAGIAGLVWGAIALRHSGIIGGCLAVLLAGVCFSTPFLRIEGGPVAMSIDRILLVLLVVFYLISRRFRIADPNSARSFDQSAKPIGKAEFVFFAFLLMLIVSTFTHNWRLFNVTTKVSYQPVTWLAIDYLMPAAMFWVARQSKVGEREALLVFGVFACFGGYLAVTSLAEYAWQNGYATSWMLFPSYIVTTAAEKGTDFVGRARGPLLNPIGNGMLLSVCMGATLFWWPRFHRFGKLLLLTAVAMSAAALCFSLTRSVWMGGILTLAIIIVPMLPREWRWPLLGVGVLAVVIITMLQWENLLAFKRDKGASAAEAKSSAELRPVLFKIARNMVCADPLTGMFGVGFGQYGEESKAFTGSTDGDYDLRQGRDFIQHNIVLSLLTETGLVGVSLFLALLIYWTRDAWRLANDSTRPLWMRQLGLWCLAALGIYLTNGMFHEVSQIAMSNMILFFVAGLASSVKSQNLAA
jgi:O-antigen ligase